MNEKEENKELIQRMAETLRNHEEPYRDGTWEQFSAKHVLPSRHMVWWPYGAAAAVLLMAASIFWFNRPPDTPVDATIPAIAVQQQAVPTDPQADVPQGSTVEPLVPLIAEKSGQRPSAAATKRVTTSNRIIEHNKEPEVADHAAVVSQEPIAAVVSTDTVTNNDVSQRVAAIAEDGPQRSAAGVFPDNPNQAFETTPAYANNETRRETSASKWNFGVVVSPSLTREKVNMGGGLAVAYQLSDKFSIGSGASISQLGVGENSNYREPAGSPVYDSPILGNEGFNGYLKAESQYKEVTSVTSNLLALDIPLDLQYKITKGLYTSVGVSFVAVLNERRTNHVVSELRETTLGESLSSKGSLSRSAFAYSEPASTHPLEGNRYTGGFVNFSLGHKMPLSSKISIAVEPYFKLPVGRLSREDMDLTNGGIRIITGF